MSNVNSAAKKPTALRGGARRIVMIAMLSAVAFVLQFLDFSIPFLIPSFVKMDVSDLPALIGAFSMGPVGELCNTLLGIAFVVPAALIYRGMRKNPASSPEEAKRKGRIAALVGCLVGSAAMGILSVPINYFITYPMYTIFMPMDAIIGMYQKLIPSVNGLLSCLVIFNMPFTFVKGILCSIITFLIYKPISGFIKGR